MDLAGERCVCVCVNYCENSCYLTVIANNGFDFQTVCIKITLKLFMRSTEPRHQPIQKKHSQAYAKGKVCVCVCDSAQVCQDFLMSFVLVVATLQSHMEVEASLCKVLSPWKTVGGSGKRRE